MYAIVDIAGQQFKVEKNKKIFVHRLDAQAGSSVEFDHILLIDDEGKVKVGNPIVKDMLVKAKVIEHLKGDKVQIFKKKRRKGYQKLNGHRQYLTELEVLDIVNGKKETVKAAQTEKAKPAAAKQAEKKVAETASAEKTKAAETKKTTTKAATAATKKTAAKKTTTAKKEASSEASKKKDTDSKE